MQKFKEKISKIHSFTNKYNHSGQIPTGYPQGGPGSQGAGGYLPQGPSSQAGSGSGPYDGQIGGGVPQYNGGAAGYPNGFSG